MNISITSEHLFNLGPIPITNSILATVIISLLLVGLSFLATRKMKKVPHGIQNAFELVLESLLNLTDGITRDRKLTEKIFPLIATFFIFILFNNWLGLIPGLGTVGINRIHDGKEVLVPFLRSGTADLNTTLALGIIAIIFVQVSGIIAIGFAKYFKKFLNFSSPIHFFVGILEFISEIVKIFSFAFRLFGNVFAGEVLLTVLSVLVPYFIPLPFYVMELFVGLIQALVFTMLTLVFIKMATTASHG